MRKNNIHFQAGEPLSAAKHTGLVLSAEEQVAAFAGEHDPEGNHAHVRFEFAACRANWNGSAWVTGLGDIAAVSQSLSRTSFILTVFDVEGLVLDPQGLGILAVDSDGHLVPWSSVVKVGAELRVTMHPRSQSFEVSIIVLGRRAVGDS